MSDLNTQQDILATLAQDYLTEKRRKRRYSLFFRSAFLLLAVLVVVSLFTQNYEESVSDTHTALIDIDGDIFSDSNLKAENIVKGLRSAFEANASTAILLRINSPGGSPVQAHYVYNEIRRLKTKYPNKKVYAVCVEACASAAYYIAAAADEIYADQASIVGSIGVIYNGFGFNSIMEKVGVDRRLVTAGQNKAFMDPFSPKNEAEEAILKNMLATVHTQFVEAVKIGRGKRLSTGSPDLFSGLFWLGADAQKLGLIDGLASPGEVTRNVIKQELVVDYTVKPNYLEQLASRFTASVSDQIMKETKVHARIESKW